MTPITEKAGIDTALLPQGIAAILVRKRHNVLSHQMALMLTTEKEEEYQFIPDSGSGSQVFVTG